MLTSAFGDRPDLVMGRSEGWLSTPKRPSRPPQTPLAKHVVLTSEARYQYNTSCGRARHLPDWSFLQRLQSCKHAISAIRGCPSLKRREFIRLVGGATAWPLAAFDQSTTVPVVGFPHSATPEGYGSGLAAFRKERGGIGAMMERPSVENG